MTTALITGGTRGIGRAVAQALADQGMHVIVGARSLADGVEAVDQIGRGATSVQLDVTDDASVRAAAAWATNTPEESMS